MTHILLLADLLAGVAALVAALLASSTRARSIVAGALCVLTGACGTIAGFLALSGTPATPVVVPTALAGLTLRIGPDRMGGLFLLVVSVVGALAALGAMATRHGPAASRAAWIAYPLFLLGMQTVPVAADVVTFSLGWELMAGASAALVLAEHARRASVGRAAVAYLAMTQASFVAIITGFGALVGVTGSTGFAELATVEPHSGAASVAFCLLLIGFAIKMGLVPLHVWLPLAHPEAPSPVSAAMSAAMVKLGAYGLALVLVRLMPGGPGWWGVVLMLVGGLSAGYGIVRAAVISDLKMLLAYSTTENLGLITLALGAYAVLVSIGRPEVAAAALLAALLLVLSHAAFKLALFLTAGAVIHGTRSRDGSGERNLDALGGLAARMPYTAVAFGVAALGAAALPASSGFVAEWVLLQSLVHAAPVGEPLPIVAALTFPLSVGVVALTAGLTVLTFVKAFGIAFLGRPRSAAAAAAQEVGRLERVAPLLAAALVLAMGVLPGWVVAAVQPVTQLPVGGGNGAGLGVILPGVGAGLHPAAVLGLIAAAGLLVAMITVVVARRAPARVTTMPWGSGGDLRDPHIQVTATSFAEPALRVFDDVLQPSRDVTVSHVGESRYLVERVRADVSSDDVVERRVYRLVLRWADWCGERARGIQNGSLHRYLVYAFAGVVVTLAAVALW